MKLGRWRRWCVFLCSFRERWREKNETEKWEELFDTTRLRHRASRTAASSAPLRLSPPRGVRSIRLCNPSANNGSRYLLSVRAGGQNIVVVVNARFCWKKIYLQISIAIEWQNVSGYFFAIDKLALLLMNRNTQYSIVISNIEYRII